MIRENLDPRLLEEVGDLDILSGIKTNLHYLRFRLLSGNRKTFLNIRKMAFVKAYPLI
jgi:hypothetical protein